MATGNAGAAAIGPTAPGSAGGMWSQIAASAGRAMATSQSTVSAFDRPQSVLIMGPMPLPVVADVSTPWLVHVTNFSQFPGGKGGAGGGGGKTTPDPGFSLASLIGPTLAGPLGKVTAAAQAAGGALGNFANALATLKPLGNLLGSVLSAGASKAGQLLAPLGNMLGKAGQAVAGTRFGRIAGRVGRGAKAVAGGAGGAALGAIKGAGGALLALGVAAQAAGQAVLGVGQAMASFVSKANPAALKVFELAVDDLTAVVGQALTPIFTLVTQGVRMFADALTPLGPIGATVAQAMKPLMGVFKIFADLLAQGLGQVGKIIAAAAPGMEAIGVAVLSVFNAMQPLYNLFLDMAGGILIGATQALSSVLTAVVPYITAFARAIGDVVTWVSNGVRELLAMIGLELPKSEGLKPGASVGAAARQAQFGQVGDAMKRTIANAFSLGTGAANPQALIASNTKAIADKANEIYELINELPEKLAQAIVDALPDIPGGETVRDAVANPGRSALQAVAASNPVTGAVTRLVDLVMDR